MELRTPARRPTLGRENAPNEAALGGSGNGRKGREFPKRPDTGAEDSVYSTGTGNVKPKRLPRKSKEKNPHTCEHECGFFSPYGGVRHFGYQDSVPWQEFAQVRVAGFHPMVLTTFFTPLLCVAEFTVVVL